MVAFFESEAGVAFLHRLVVAAHFVITQTSPGGIRPVCLFLELSHLDRFVGASYGPHQKVSKAMEQAIIDGLVKSQNRAQIGDCHPCKSLCHNEGVSANSEL